MPKTINPALVRSLSDADFSVYVSLCLIGSGENFEKLSTAAKLVHEVVVDLFKDSGNADKN